jgi:hypothetical protein
LESEVADLAVFGDRNREKKEKIIFYVSKKKAGEMWGVGNCEGNGEGRERWQSRNLITTVNRKPRYTYGPMDGKGKL